MSGGSQASRRAADGGQTWPRSPRGSAPSCGKDVAVCLEQAAERGVDPGLLDRGRPGGAVLGLI